MASSRSWLTYLLIGGAAYLLLRPGALGALTLGPGVAIDWWFNPTTQALVAFHSQTPPSAGFRPASAVEIDTYNPMVL